MVRGGRFMLTLECVVTFCMFRKLLVAGSHVTPSMHGHVGLARGKGCGTGWGGTKNDSDEEAGSCDGVEEEGDDDDAGNVLDNLAEDDSGRY